MAKPRPNREERGNQREKTEKHMITFKIRYDQNGNRVVCVIIPGARGFSCQTNGRLPMTHRDGVGPWTGGEVNKYVKAHGTKRQKELLGRTA